MNVDTCDRKIQALIDEVKFRQREHKLAKALVYETQVKVQATREQMLKAEAEYRKYMNSLVKEEQP